MPKKILIHPDIHFRTFWKEPTLTHLNEVDKVIFLGDYLDGYPHEKIDKTDGIRNFQEIIQLKRDNMEKVVLLLGNHDLSYFYPQFTKCRFDTAHEAQIRQLFDDNRELFQLAHGETVGNKKYLFTHAGLLPEWAEKHLSTVSAECINDLLTNPNGNIILDEISYYRGGYDPCGSIVWADIREQSFDPPTNIPNYDFQVFGHTQLIQDPIITDTFACLDCRRAFILDETNKIQNT